MKKRILILVCLALALCGCSKTESTETQNSISVNENMPDYEQTDNKGYGWGFKKEKGQKPNIQKETVDLFTRYDAYFADNSEEKVIYLTFDEGYEAGYTSSILDTLKKCDVKAAFFVTGDYFDREKELVERMVSEGHIVGNHTEHHHNLHKLADAEKIREEIKSLDNKYFECFGTHMEYMRPPEGEYSERVLAVAKELEYKTIFWSFAYKDWIRNDIRGKEYAVNSVVPYFHNGEIILLHAVSKDNCDALEEIINNAKEQGYKFQTLDRLCQ